MFVRSSKESNLLISSLCCCEGDGGRELALSTKTNLFESEIFNPSQRSEMFSDRCELAASPVGTILAEVDILEKESKIFCQCDGILAPSLPSRHLLEHLSASKRCMFSFCLSLSLQINLKRLTAGYLSWKYDYHVILRQLTVSLLKMNKSSLFYT